jgi:hypothetical protein
MKGKLWKFSFSWIQTCLKSELLTKLWNERYVYEGMALVCEIETYLTHDHWKISWNFLWNPIWSFDFEFRWAYAYGCLSLRKKIFLLLGQSIFSYILVLTSILIWTKDTELFLIKSPNYPLLGGEVEGICYTRYLNNVHKFCWYVLMK